MENDLTKFIENFNIVDNALDMRSLIRWNGRNLNRHENLSEHTHLVVSCVVYLYETLLNDILRQSIDYNNLIKKCLLHDSLEILRGDILSVTKDAISGLREHIDNEEKIFIRHFTDNCELCDDLVRLADTMACYKFIEFEMQYPCNDFTKNVYISTKNIYNNILRDFKAKYNLTSAELDIPVNNKFTKGYLNDAGVDIILEHDVEFLPHSTTAIELNVTVTPNINEMAVLCARTSAAIKGLNVAMCPIDSNYNGKITAIVHNISNGLITYKKGQAFCQWVGIKLANIADVSDNIVIKNKGIRQNGKLGSTGD